MLLHVASCCQRSTIERIRASDSSTRTFIKKISLTKLLGQTVYENCYVNEVQGNKGNGDLDALDQALYFIWTSLPFLYLTERRKHKYVTQLFFVLSYLTCVQGVRENFRIDSRARFVKSYYFVPTKYIQLTSLGSTNISTYMREHPLEDLSTYEFVELCLKRVTQIEPNRSKQYNKETKMLW